MADKIIYSCPYVPAEWIAAHGLMPSRILPAPADDKRPCLEIMAGMCPYMHGFANQACSMADARAIILTTVCDQMRRAYDLIDRRINKPVFLMTIPSTWQTVEAKELYKSEIKRLGRFLVAIGGNEPVGSTLVKTMRDYDEHRSSLRAAAGTLTDRAFSESIAEFNRTGKISVNDPIENTKPDGVPLAFLGGPISQEEFVLFDMIRDAGGTVVLDGTETGERTLPAPFDHRRMSADPLDELANAYFGSIPDAFRRPNSMLYEWLGQEIQARGVRGLVLIRQIWCDIWHAELHRLREWAGVPVLDIDLNSRNSAARNSNQIQAFLETLS